METPCAKIATVTASTSTILDNLILYLDFRAPTIRSMSLVDWP